MGILSIAMASIPLGWASGPGAGEAPAARGAARLSEEELALLERLKARDAEVRKEAAARRADPGSVLFIYQLGPDGRRYAADLVPEPWPAQDREPAGNEAGKEPDRQRRQEADRPVEDAARAAEDPPAARRAAPEEGRPVDDGSEAERKAEGDREAAGAEGRPRVAPDLRGDLAVRPEAARQRRQAEVEDLYRRLEHGAVAGTVLDRRA